MNAVIFLGPTLGPEPARLLPPGVELRPPAGCGDIYRALRERPAAIGLIDGVFEQRLSVWHKEILWALESGVRVYGAGSMGALRAAELHSFGMVGVGRIFEWFRDGVLQDDDEVAIVHDPEAPFRARSDAMVNIRATLECARCAGVIGQSALEHLLHTSKSWFYPRRSRAALLNVIRSAADATGELTRLYHWLGEPKNWLDQKRMDGEALLLRMRDDAKCAHGTVPRAKPFTFEYTEAWHELCRRMDNPR